MLQGRGVRNSDASEAKQPPDALQLSLIHIFTDQIHSYRRADRGYVICSEKCDHLRKCLYNIGFRDEMCIRDSDGRAGQVASEIQKGVCA